MSVQAITWAYSIQGLPAGPKFVLVTLANYANATGRQCFPGQKTLALDTGLDERTIRRCMKQLENAGLIRRVQRRRDDGTRTSDDVILYIKRTDCPIDHLTL